MTHLQVIQNSPEIIQIWSQRIIFCV